MKWDWFTVDSGQCMHCRFQSFAKHMTHLPHFFAYWMGRTELKTFYAFKQTFWMVFSQFSYKFALLHHFRILVTKFNPSGSSVSTLHTALYDNFLPCVCKCYIYGPIRVFYLGLMLHQLKCVNKCPLVCQTGFQRSATVDSEEVKFFFIFILQTVRNVIHG